MRGWIVMVCVRVVIVMVNDDRETSVGSIVIGEEKDRGYGILLFLFTPLSVII